MSASGPPTPDEIAEATGIDPMEAQAIADSMEPLQNLTGVGGSVGSALSDAPGAGPRLVGVMLESMAQQVNLASTSAEAVARAVEFYIEAQTGTLEDLFPPPGEVADKAGQDAEPLVDAIARMIENSPP